MLPFEPSMAFFFQLQLTHMWSWLLLRDSDINYHVFDLFYIVYYKTGSPFRSFQVFLVYINMGYSESYLKFSFSFLLYLW